VPIFAASKQVFRVTSWEVTVFGVFLILKRRKQYE